MKETKVSFKRKLKFRGVLYLRRRAASLHNLCSRAWQRRWLAVKRGDTSAVKHIDATLQRYEIEISAISDLLKGR